MTMLIFLCVVLSKAGLSTLTRKAGPYSIYHTYCYAAGPSYLFAHSEHKLRIPFGNSFAKLNSVLSSIYWCTLYRYCQQYSCFFLKIMFMYHGIKLANFS